MENKNSFILILVSVIVLFVAVVGASFAYFAASTTTTATSALQVTTAASAPVFTSSSTDGISVTVTTANMQQSAGGAGVVAASDTGNLVVSLTGNTGTTCSYNITYTHDTSADTYTPTSGQEANEFLVSGTSNKSGGEPKAFTNRRYDQLTGTIVSGATISASQTITWTFTATIYNLGVNQFAALGNKTFKGSFKVSTVTC